MQFTSAGSGDATAVISGAGLPVLGGRQYTAVASFKTAVTARSVRTGIQWKNKAGGIVSTSNGSSVSDTTSVWTAASVTATAPLDAVTACPTLTVLSTAAAEVHRVDEVSFHAGTSNTWTLGGLEPTTRLVVQRAERVDPDRGNAANWVRRQVASGGSLLRTTEGFRTTDAGAADILTWEPVAVSSPGLTGAVEAIRASLRGN